jgi:hypothetical protein
VASISSRVVGRDLMVCSEVPCRGHVVCHSKLGGSSVGKPCPSRAAEFGYNAAIRDRAVPGTEVDGTGRGCGVRCGALWVGGRKTELSDGFAECGACRG